MSRISIRNSLNKADNGKIASTTSELMLIDHPDFGLVFALVSNGGTNIIGIYDDLAVADKERCSCSRLPNGITPIEMSEKVDIHRSGRKSIKTHIFGVQSIEKSLVKCTRVLYGSRTSL